MNEERDTMTDEEKDVRLAHRQLGIAECRLMGARQDADDTRRELERIRQGYCDADEETVRAELVQATSLRDLCLIAFREAQADVVVTVNRLARKNMVDVLDMARGVFVEPGE